MANVSKLLHTTTDPETFLANLTAEDEDLKAAKRKIRGHLRLAFAVASRAEFDVEVQPRFFTQGSSSYRTLNDPAWPPGQQKDLDDGCYLPLSFVKGERPSKAAEQFFAFVDRVLGELAEDEGWELIQKPTCVRLVIANDAHVDIPLYAIPDRDFALLEARATQDHAMVEKRAPDRWDALPSDKVLLAHRVEGWKSSDPRKIHTWFLKAVDDFGERLRRDCRYLKAWRDHHHLDDDHLSSILLMACAWNAYKAVGEPFLPDREDQRLLRVVELLPAMLRKDMANPASQGRKPQPHVPRGAVADGARGREPSRPPQGCDRGLRREAPCRRPHAGSRSGPACRIARIRSASPCGPRRPWLRSRSGTSPPPWSGARRVVDGGSAARAAVHDALGQRGFTPASPAAGASLYAGILDPDDLGIPTIIAVDDLDFVAYPCIRIEPGFTMPVRTLPHVAGLDRSLCYYAKGSVILDRYDPGGTVLQCLAQAETVLRDAVAGHSDDDFADEFYAYWGSTYVYVDLPRDHVGPARLCRTALDRGDRTPLVATTGRSWFMARGERTRRRADAGEPLMVVAVDRPLTFAATEAWPPEALPDLDRWLARAAPDLVGMVERVLRTGTDTSAAVLIRAPNGMYCYRIKVPPHLRRPEFLSCRRTRLPEIMKRQPTATPVERFVGHRADTGYLFERNLGGMRNLAGMKILLVGCGTIGGFLAQQLAQCGAGAGRGSLTLVDPDSLKPGNIGRHILGVPFLGENKAKACAAFLRAQLPPLTIEGRVDDVRALYLRWRHYDLVVDATGEEALSVALNERAVRARPGGPPHLFVWLAGNGAAAQCLLTGEPGRACLKCLKPALADPPRFPVLRPGVDVETVTNVSCGDPDYIPFPVSRSVAAAALACEVALDWANGDPGDRFRSLILDARRTLPVPSGSPSPVEACPACGPAA